jgi:hypothetical protein
MRLALVISGVVAHSRRRGLDRPRYGLFSVSCFELHDRRQQMGLCGWGDPSVWPAATHFCSSKVIQRRWVPTRGGIEEWGGRQGLDLPGDREASSLAKVQPRC